MRISFFLILTAFVIGGPAACRTAFGQSTSGAAVANNPRSPVPSKKELDAALKSLKSKSGIDVSEIKATEAANVAGSLVSDLAGETDPLKRYAMMSSAMLLASKAGEVSLAFRAADLMSAEFAVEGVRLKADVLTRQSKLRQPLPNFYDLTMLSVQLALESRDAYKFYLAIEVLDDGIGYSKKIPEISITPQLMALKEDLRNSAKEFLNVASAKQKWESGQKNPEAAASWGRFLCLSQRRWKDGLQILSDGPSTNVLAELAKRERGGLSDFEDIIAISDAWRSQANGETKPNVISLKRHAWDVGQQGFHIADAKQLGALEIRMAREFGETPIIRTQENENGLSLRGASANVGGLATIEMWIRTSDSDGSIIAKRTNSDDSTVGLLIEGGRICYYAHGAAHSSLQYTETRVDDGIWHHVAAVKILDKLQLYVDGLQAGPSIIIQNENLSKTPWHIGFMMIEQKRPLDATYARIRISAIARYHFPFQPELDYSTDATTLLFH